MLGADVIKVQHAEESDQSRQTGSDRAHIVAAYGFADRWKAEHKA